MNIKKNNSKILLSLISSVLLVLGSCEESLPLAESDLADTWYSDLGISEVDETIWIFKSWGSLFDSKELDKYGEFQSEAIKYIDQTSGVIVKRTERNGIRVGSADLGVWILNKSSTRPAVNILWLSNENGLNGQDIAYFSLDSKGVRNLVHNDLVFRNSGSSRTMAETIIIFAIIGAAIGAIIQYFYSNKKLIINEPLDVVREKRKKIAPEREIIKKKPKKEKDFDLKIEKEKKPLFDLKIDEFNKK